MIVPEVDDAIVALGDPVNASMHAERVLRAARGGKGHAGSRGRSQACVGGKAPFDVIVRGTAFREKAHGIFTVADEEGGSRDGLCLNRIDPVPGWMSERDIEPWLACRILAAKETTLSPADRNPPLPVADRVLGGQVGQVRRPGGACRVKEGALLQHVRRFGEPRAVPVVTWERSASRRRLLPKEPRGMMPKVGLVFTQQIRNSHVDLLERRHRRRPGGTCARVLTWASGAAVPRL